MMLTLYQRDVRRFSKTWTRLPLGMYMFFANHETYLFTHILTVAFTLKSVLLQELVSSPMPTVRTTYSRVGGLPLSLPADLFAIDLASVMIGNVYGHGG
jgi:hypothetical protein